MTSKLADLFFTFARIGGLTFGGGYAMLPLLQKEIVEKRGWATDGELGDYFALSQCTPGIIAVNTATFVGYKQRGMIGGIVATLGVVFPSLIIITLIAAFISGFAELEIVKNAFAGIRVAVCVMILGAVLRLYKSSAVDKPAACIFFAVFLLSLFTPVSPIIFIMLAGLAGVLLKRKGGEKQ